MEVKIERLDNFGRGICYIDGKICFVENALPDEVVEIDIIRSNKKFIEAAVLNYIVKSSSRVNITCPFYSECGGCQFLNYEFDKENLYKLNKVKNLVSRIGHLDSELVTDVISSNEYNYRNKVVFHVSDRELGFYKEKTNDLVSIDNCFLLRDEINEIIPELRKIVSYRKNKINEIIVRVSNKNSDLMVNIDGEVEELYKLESYVKSLYINYKLVSGDVLISNIGEYKFYVSPKSFFQVNASIVEKLYDEVLNFVSDKQVKNTLDLYCGAGTIGMYISKYVDNVLGIDVSKSSIKDANRNKKLNKVDNISFICSKVEDYIDKLSNNYDLVIVDPPRAGLDNKTIDYLGKINSKNIIYISCDPATLARDLNLLSDKYNVLNIKVFNMFSKTYHCESVAILERK